MNISTASCSIWRASLVLALLTLLGFGLLYSLLATGMGQALFPAQANGSLLLHEGRVVGSLLVAQPFSAAHYFQPRPSAVGYDTMALAGSNQALTHADLRLRLQQARSDVARREGVAPQDVPGDLVTQSGSGADPHLSPAAVQIQIARVARARGMAVAQVEHLVAVHSAGRQYGLFGQPRVNVLALNLSLDAQAR